MAKSGTAKVDPEAALEEPTTTPGRAGLTPALHELVGVSVAG
jgi:hypothetical protein